MAIIKQKEQRVGVFIDAQNIYHSAKNLYRASVNFKEILEKAVSGRQLIRAVAYVIKTEAGDEDAFFDALVEMGIETKQKDLQIFHTGAKKADWDVGLAIDAVSMIDKLDVVIIVSGDGDFIPLVKYLRYAGGCQVEAISFAKSSSSKLIEEVDDFVDMSEDKEKYLMGWKNRRERIERINTNKKKLQKIQKEEKKEVKTKTKIKIKIEKVKKAVVAKKTESKIKKVKKAQRTNSNSASSNNALNNNKNIFKEEKIKITGLTKEEENEVDNFLNSNNIKKRKVINKKEVKNISAKQIQKEEKIFKKKEVKNNFKNSQKENVQSIEKRKPVNLIKNKKGLKKNKKTINTKNEAVEIVEKKSIPNKKKATIKKNFNIKESMGNSETSNDKKTLKTKKKIVRKLQKSTQKKILKISNNK